MKLTSRPARGQFARFCLVGASGYAANLAVYATLIALGMHYLAAAAVSFLVAATSNFYWNRTWTFAARGPGWRRQCLRALLVSSLSLGLNQLFLLALVTAGGGHLEAQAAAILLATPPSFAANKLWAFADQGRPKDVAGPLPAEARS
jgi:putative flippase GtrA